MVRNCDILLYEIRGDTMKKVFSYNPDIYKNAYMNWRTDKHQPIHNLNALAEGYFIRVIGQNVLVSSNPNY